MSIQAETADETRPKRRRVSGRIDVHHHFMPQAYIRAWGEEKLGSITAAGRVALWSVELSLKLMDSIGVATAMMSVSSPGWPAGSAESRQRLCRICNDTAASLVRDHPGRFGMYVNLPLPDLDLSLRELEYGLDSLHADGVALFTNYSGVYLGDPTFIPLFEELDRRKAVVFIHPISPAHANKLPGISESTLDYPLETTRTVVSLLYYGVPEIFPNIRFILPHAGGVLPYLAGRIATFSDLNENFRQRGFEAVLPALQRFYYDITQSANQVTFAALLQLVPPSQLLFGSDVPFARQAQIDLTDRELSCLGLDDAALAGIDRDNALALFQRLGRLP